MLKILGEYYYVDMDMIDTFTKIEDTSEPTEENEMDGTKVHIVKYETVKFMLEIVMDQQSEVDEKLLGSSELSIPFKLAFNTLLNKKIINKL
jgi:hypothetical protein